MIHYWIELGLWMAGLFLFGCLLGAVGYRLFGAGRGRLTGGS